MVRELVGVNMAWLTRKGRAHVCAPYERIAAADQDSARTCSRLYAAVVLLAIIQEVCSAMAATGRAWFYYNPFIW